MASNKRKYTIKDVHKWIRAGLQLIFFLLLPSIFTSAFAGVKYIFTQIGAGNSIELTSFVTILIAISLYTFVFGRFFCGYACPFGSMGDLFRWLYKKICKRMKKKPVKFSDKVTSKLKYLKYLILVGILLMCFKGVYSVTRGYSPWDVFSMLIARHFSLGGYIGGLIILLAIIVGMCLEDRFFCRFLCPMGAIFSLLPVLPVFSLQRNRENCIRGCSACTKMCPASVELPEKGKPEVSGECFQCGLCADTCPKKNISCGISSLKGNEIWFTIVKAVILFVLFKVIGL